MTDGGGAGGRGQQALHAHVRLEQAINMAHMHASRTCAVCAKGSGDTQPDQPGRKDVGAECGAVRAMTTRQLVTVMGASRLRSPLLSPTCCTHLLHQGQASQGLFLCGPPGWCCCCWWCAHILLPAVPAVLAVEAMQACLQAAKYAQSAAFHVVTDNTRPDH